MNQKIQYEGVFQKEPFVKVILSVKTIFLLVGLK